MGGPCCPLLVSSIHFSGQPKQHQGSTVRFSTRRQGTGRFFYFKFHRNSYSCKLKKALPHLSTPHGYPLDIQFLNCSASAVFLKNPSSSEIIHKAKVKICVFTHFCELRHTHCISIQYQTKGPWTLQETHAEFSDLPKQDKIQPWDYVKSVFVNCPKKKNKAWEKQNWL